MDTTAQIVCKAFLDKRPSEKKRALIKLLPKSEQETLASLPGSFLDPTQGLRGFDERLKAVDPTWIAPTLRNFSKGDIACFLSALPETHLQEMKKILLYSSQPTPLTKVSKEFLQSVLWNQLTESKRDLLPIECLPSSPLNAFLSLNPSQIHLLINFLGMHDLSIAVRQIIDTTKLKQIYSALSEDEQLYLKQLAQKKDPIAFQKIDLAKWKGDRESLQASLQKRGLNRLAKAFFGQDASLIWYVTHLLDTTTASSFEKLCVPLEHMQASVILVDQVIALMTMIQTPHSRETL